jgi:hypothetical protein
MKSFIKNHTKIFVLLCLTLAICLGLAFDYAWSYTYKIEVVSITPEQPVADSRQPVEIVVKLTHFGSPVEGHSLYLLPQNGGTMSANIVKTDADGIAVYTYYPYTETFLMKAQPINFYCHDENNSVIFEINTKTEFVIDLQSKNG